MSHSVVDGRLVVGQSRRRPLPAGAPAVAGQPCADGARPESTTPVPAAGPRPPLLPDRRRNPYARRLMTGICSNVVTDDRPEPSPSAGCDQMRYPAGLRMSVATRPQPASAVIVQQLLIYGYTATEVLTY
ncbi:hypothetical protein PJI17_22115 [Mycobacterium kansasii]